MAAVMRYKHLVLVAFVLLCFITITTTEAARSLGVAPSSYTGDEMSHDDALKHGIKEDDGVMPDESADLLAMDYSPASKKPPIHN
ncbi:uncharacterized protein LOC126798316 [Argentina anserina]|uniref:uncharacterized protein LOC126798316 n=1 Tax=Argentina anserina TaxID=57926 RepID=UPI002176363C|nr:uncharacterized protein LOC126798316 [Potentilla anserina]